MSGAVAPWAPIVWAAMVISGATLVQPPPRRRTVALAEGPSSPLRPLAGLGAALRRVARRPVDHDADARVGRAAMVAIPAALIDPILAFVIVGGFVLGPRVAAVRAARRRLDAIWRDVPDVVDLFRLAVSAGLTVPLAVRAVARRTSGPIGEGLAHAVEQIDRGAPVGDTVMGLTTTVGEPLRPLASALAGADRYGVALDVALDRVGAELRLERRRRSEIAARRIPVKMLFPLVALVLPAFALLTVVPVLVSSLRALAT